MNRPVLSPARRRVLIVDDSRTIRGLLRATLDADPRLSVVGEAADAFEARSLIKALSPDVLTLDVEMPRMNGLEFLEKLMRLRPMPVVMVSTRTSEKSADAVRALSIGAVDCVDVARVEADAGQRRRLTDALVTAASARVRTHPARTPRPAVPDAPYRWNGRVVLVGSSTGGVDAIERLLSAFPPDGPPVLIAQHMPESFLKSFAQRLNEVIAPEARLARDGDVPAQGRVFLAPGGGRHLAFRRDPSMALALVPGGGSDLHVPSVDRLFGSAAHHAARIAAVILTGMGRDGAAGMRALRDGGALTFAQSAESCVVDGMPGAARQAGAVSDSIPLDALGAAVLDACRAPQKRPADG